MHPDASGGRACPPPEMQAAAKTPAATPFALHPLGQSNHHTVLASSPPRLLSVCQPHAILTAPSATRTLSVSTVRRGAGLC
eukprot:7500448-Pyramimonas_sp.AAC.1